MPTPTPRLGLLKPSTADPFVTADLAANWQKVDDVPGYALCTSTTRPAWTSAQQGMLISERDTGLQYRWTGTTWERLAPRGLLKTTAGAWARGQRTTDFSTSNFTTWQLAVSVDNVVVPDGRRTLQLAATWPQAANSSGFFYGAIFRSNVSGQAPRITNWAIAGDSTSPVAGAQGQGGTFVTYEPDGLPAGVYSWSFQIVCHPTLRGTSVLRAYTDQPIEIAVVEL